MSLIVAISYWMARGFGHSRFSDPKLRPQSVAGSARRADLARLAHRFGNKAREREGRSVNLRRPVFGREAARLAVARCYGFCRRLPQGLIIGRPAHRHVAADISRDRGDVTASVREQLAELRNAGGELRRLKDRHAILRHHDAALV